MLHVPRYLNLIWNSRCMQKRKSGEGFGSALLNLKPTQELQEILQILKKRQGDKRREPIKLGKIKLHVKDRKQRWKKENVLK